VPYLKLNANSELKIKIYQLLDILNLDALGKKTVLMLKGESIEELTEIIRNPENIEALIRTLQGLRRAAK
jgi:hypothetical protein